MGEPFIHISQVAAPLPDALILHTRLLAIPYTAVRDQSGGSTGNTRRMRVFASANRSQLLIISACVALTAIVSWHFVKDQTLLYDFFAFYCGGSVYASGADPYTVEPLRSCENALLRTPQAILVVPAPLPEYDLAAFSLIARIPFPIARILWEILLALAFGVSVFYLVRLTRLDTPLVFATLFFSEAIPSLFLGQLVPIAAAALIVAMYCASRKRFACAALFTASTLIEPHLGLGACASLFLWVPRARLALLACLGAPFIASFVGHLPLSISYLRDILPIHILSEANREDQLSLTHLFILLGAALHAAVALGQASYILLLGISIACARALARRTGEPAFLIGIPPAFAVIGGPFVHIHHVAVAIPAALLLFTRIPRAQRIIGPAIMLLAIPWDAYLLLFHLMPIVMIFTMALAARLLRVSLLRQACTALLVACVISAAVAAYVRPATANMKFAYASPNAPAELIWQEHVRIQHSSNEILFLLLALPTWTGLLTTALYTISAAKDETLP
jgi:hypothetical protein